MAERTAMDKSALASEKPFLETAVLFLTEVPDSFLNGVLGLLGLLISPTCRFYCRLLWWLVAEGVEDEELVKLVETIGYKEGLPVVINPVVLDPKESPTYP